MTLNIIWMAVILLSLGMGIARGEWELCGAWFVAALALSLCG